MVTVNSNWLALSVTGGGGWGGGHVKIKQLYFYAPNILIFKNI